MAGVAARSAVRQVARQVGSAHEDVKSRPPQLRMVEIAAYQRKRNLRDVREKLAKALELIKSLP